MLLRASLVLFALSALHSVALAESCGSAPIAPALASAAEIRQKSPADAAAAKHDAFVEIKNWQADLKTYRACLTNVSNEARREVSNLDPNKDTDKITGLQQQSAAVTHQYDRTVDMEERVVNEFHAVQEAYCGRSDVNRSSCPK